MRTALLLVIPLVGCSDATAPPDNVAVTTESPSESPDPEAAGENAEPSQPLADEQPVSTPTEDQAASQEPAVEEPAQPAPLPRRNPAEGVEEITFDDINLQLQADVVFRPWMLSDRARELDGRRVRIAGYMLPHMKTEGIETFVLLRNTECKFGPGGQPDHLLNIKLREGQTTIYRNSPIEVEGKLTIDPFTGPDGNTWYIYDLSDASNVAALRR